MLSCLQSKRNRKLKETSLENRCGISFPVQIATAIYASKLMDYMESSVMSTLEARSHGTICCECDCDENGLCGCQRDCSYGVTVMHLCVQRHT